MPGLSVYLQPIQNLSFGARQARTLYIYTLQGLDSDTLYDFSEKLAARLRRLPLSIRSALAPIFGRRIHIPAIHSKSGAERQFGERAYDTLARARPPTTCSTQNTALGTSPTWSGWRASPAASC